MNPARRAVLTHGLPRVRDWALWSLPRPLLILWTVATCGYLAWIGAGASSFQVRIDNILLFCALLGCGAFTVEMARRASEPSGVVKDVYAVWELPMVFLLPSFYALIVPAIRLTLTQFMVRRAPVYKRVYTAAAIGVAYGCARLVYVSALPAGVEPRQYLFDHTAQWLVAAGAGAVTQWLINQVLILGAYKLEVPGASIRKQLLARETLHNDATELCAALLVAVGMTISALTLIIALPLATLLQRSFRHAQLLSEARADAKTGLLNAATWEREAAAEVARAVRTFSPLAVVLLDLDRFKHINDTHGHLVGDDVLRNIAGSLSDVLREYDLAGRFGGEEFVLLLPQTRAPDALRIAERVRAHIARLPISAPGGERVPVTVSIGVAALDSGTNRGLPELLAAADAALYRAKASGRDQVQMISTGRGLSAVVHGDDHDSGPEAIFRGGPGAPVGAGSSAGPGVPPRRPVVAGHDGGPVLATARQPGGKAPGRARDRGLPGLSRPPGGSSLVYGPVPADGSRPPGGQSQDGAGQSRACDDDGSTATTSALTV